MENIPGAHTLLPARIPEIGALGRRPLSPALLAPGAPRDSHCTLAGQGPLPAFWAEGVGTIMTVTLEVWQFLSSLPPESPLPFSVESPSPTAPCFSPFPGSFQRQPLSPITGAPSNGTPRDLSQRGELMVAVKATRMGLLPPARPEPPQTLTAMQFTGQETTEACPRPHGSEGRSRDLNSAQSHPKGLSNPVRASGQLFCVFVLF